MSGKPGLAEIVTLELYDAFGGGLRANNISLDTHLDGHRETMRSWIRDYAGQVLGSTIRQISLNEFMDFDWLSGGIDFEATFLAGGFLTYRMTMVGSGRVAEGQCHITKTSMKSADGKPTEINAELEGEPSLFV